MGWVILHLQGPSNIYLWETFSLKSSSYKFHKNCSLIFFNLWNGFNNLFNQFNFKGLRHHPQRFVRSSLKTTSKDVSKTKTFDLLRKIIFQSLWDNIQSLWDNKYKWWFIRAKKLTWKNGSWADNIMKYHSISLSY